MEVCNKQLLNILKMDVKELRCVGQRSNVSLCESICLLCYPGPSSLSFTQNFSTPLSLDSFEGLYLSFHSVFKFFVPLLTLDLLIIVPLFKALSVFVYIVLCCSRFFQSNTISQYINTHVNIYNKADRVKQWIIEGVGC